MEAYKLMPLRLPCASLGSFVYNSVRINKVGKLFCKLLPDESISLSVISTMPVHCSQLFIIQNHTWKERDTLKNAVVAIPLGFCILGLQCISHLNNAIIMFLQVWGLFFAFLHHVHMHVQTYILPLC